MAALAISAAVVSGCVTAGALDEHGYSNRTYPYRVAYRDASAKRLLGPNWQLDNWSFDKDRRDWSEKSGDDYVAQRTMDLDRNGTVSPGERAKEAIFDLKLVSRTTGAVVWTKAHPIHPDDADRKLSILLDNYVDSLRGNGLYAQGSVFSIERVASRRFTTFVTERSEGTLSGSPMIAATIELAEVDRLQVRPDERNAKIRLVMVKYPYLLDWGNANIFQRVCPTYPAANGSQRRCYTLLVLGYYNTPEHFAEELPAFEQILKQVSISSAPGNTSPPAKRQASAPSPGVVNPAPPKTSAAPGVPVP
jgi:hypothetical protein